jgi:hypothetical protein
MAKTKAKQPLLKEVPTTPFNPKWELFCAYYVQNSDTFGNGTQSYGEAYEYNLDELSRDDAMYDWEGEGKERRKIITVDSTYDRAINVCAMQSSRLLRNAKIQHRIREMLNEMLRDEVIDGELSKLVMQDKDLAAKMSAIREYNKLRNRITDHVKHTGSIQFGEMEAKSNEELANLAG